jgi:hypothetical protein
MLEAVDMSKTDDKKTFNINYAHGLIATAT